jgi:hypothetical protein
MNAAFGAVALPKSQSEDSVQDVYERSGVSVPCKIQLYSHDVQSRLLPAAFTEP